MTLLLVSDLAETYQTLGRHDDVARLVTESLPIAERVLKPDDPAVTSMRSTLGASKLAQGRYADAVPLLRDVVASMTRKLGPDDPDVLATTNNLLVALLATHQYQECAPLAADLARRADTVFPPKHPAAGFSYLTAARSYLGIHNTEDAERMALIGHERLITAYDEVNWEVEKSAAIIRNVYTNAHRPDQLRAWHLKSLRIRLMVAGADEADGLLKVASDMEKEMLKATGAYGEPGIYSVVRTAADELAPPGHERRARFFANLSRWAGRIGKTDDARALAATAAIALNDSKRRDDDAKLVELATVESKTE